MKAIAYDCPPLAYNLHKFGPGRCSRKGGTRVCGICIRDEYAPALGFQRRPPVEAIREEIA